MRQATQIGFGSRINSAEFPVQVSHKQIKMYDAVCACERKNKNKAVQTRTRCWEEHRWWPAHVSHPPTGVTTPQKKNKKSAASDFSFTKHIILWNPLSVQSDQRLWTDGPEMHSSTLSSTTPTCWSICCRVNTLIQSTVCYCEYIFSTAGLSKAPWSLSVSEPHTSC